MKKQEWTEISRRGKPHHILLLDSIVTLFQEKSFGRAHKTSWNPQYYRQFNSNRWFSQKDYKKYLKILQDGEINHKDYLLENAKEYENRIIAFKEFVNKNKNIDFSNKDTSFIISIFTEWFEHTKNVLCFAYDSIFINRFLPDKVILQIAKKEKDVVKQNYLLTVLLRADKPTELWQEKRALVQLVKENKTNTKKLIERIKKHQQQFAHLGYYFFRGKAYSYEDVEKRFQEHISLSKIDLDRLWDEIREQEDNGEETKRVMSHLCLDDETIHNIQILKKYAAISNYVDETYSYSVHHLIKLWLEIAKRLHLSWNELFSLRAKEIIQALQNESTYPNLKQIAAERYKDHAFILEEKDVHILVGKALKKYRNTQEEEQEILANIRKIKGQVASSGVASGKIHILFTDEDVTSFKRGEILVSVATNPIFMPAMEKAIAIITDEGGLLSHAAVVSRELHVPCIVGTKVATRILKDNDLVEVDATKGIITILKKNNTSQ